MKHFFMVKVRSKNPTWVKKFFRRAIVLVIDFDIYKSSTIKL